MKILKTAAALATTALVLTLTGCNRIDDTVKLNSTVYNLTLSIRDADGNNLLTPLAEDKWTSSPGQEWKGEINPEKYELEVIFPRITEWPFNFVSAISLYRFEGEEEYNLYAQTVTFSGSKQDYLTYRLYCPAVFGDEYIHSITPEWKNPAGGAINGNLYPECGSVAFDGRKYEVSQRRVLTYEGVDYCTYYAEIVIGGKEEQPDE